MSATQLPTFSQYHTYARLHDPQKKVARGLLTLVKKSLIHEELPDSFSTNNVDILGIRYMDSKSSWHHIFNVYVAVDSHFDANIFQLDKSLILGDFNARHLTWCTRTNKLGRKLIKYIENNNCVVLNDRQPTTRYNTALDLAITKANYNIHWTWDVFHLWTNDHFGQYIVHHSTRLAQPHQDELAWRTNKADWSIYKQLLDEKSTPLLISDYQDNVELLLDHIVQNIQLSAEASVPRTKTKRNPPRKWRLSEAAKDIHKDISKATKAFKSNPCTETIQNLRNIQSAGRNTLKEDRFQATAQWAQSLSDKTSKQLWEEIKRLKGKPKAQLYPHPLLKANELLHDFTSRGNLEFLPEETQYQLSIRQKDRLHAFKRNILLQDDTDILFNNKELTTVLTKTTNTAPGEDTFTYNFFYNAGPIARQAFLRLFNMIWVNSIWPTQWKTALIVPIPKPSGTGLRPISLLNCLSKIFERMIQLRLTYKLPFFKEAYGYQEGRGTTDAVIHLVNLVSLARRQASTKRVVAVFFDLSKAFERARRLPVIEALIALGVKGRLLAIIGSWIHNRSAKVKLQGHTTQAATLQCGVPQGSILSPTIFNALVHSLVQPVIDIPGVHILTYADDIVAVANQHAPFTQIQKAIDLLTESAAALGLSFEPTKTAAMSFFTQKPPPTLYIEDTPINYHTNYKYLGVILDRTFSFIPYANYIKDKVKNRFNIFRILGGITRANTKLLLLLYNAVVQPLLEYCAPVFILAKKTAIDRIQVVQRRVLRTVLTLPIWCRVDIVYAEANVLPFAYKVEEVAVKYLLTAQTKSHPTTTALTAYTQFKDPRVFKAKTWAIKVGHLAQKIQLPTIVSLPTIKLQPWIDPPILPILQHGLTKEKDLTEIKNRVLNILFQHPFSSNVYYTDGSLDATGRAGWGVVTPNKEILIGRVTDFSPTTLIELQAIKNALIHAWVEKSYEIIIATDSKSAIQALTKTSKFSFKETVTEILILASAIKHQASAPVLVWVPSHCQIQGNEEADQAANEATKLDTIENIEISRTVIKTKVHQHFHQKWIADLKTKAHTNHKLQWYMSTSGLPHNIKSKPVIDKHFEVNCRLLRAGIYQFQRYKNHYWICQYCGGIFNIVHYLIRCPFNKANARPNLLNLLTDQEFNLNDLHKASLIMRKSYFLNHKYLHQLIKVQPFWFEGFPFDTG